MKEIKREVTKEQIIYEATKEELEEIKRIERVKGRNDVIEYIWFYGKNFKLKLNIAGGISLLEDIVDFILGRKNYINNIYGYSFDDYLRKCRNT